MTKMKYDWTNFDVNFYYPAKVGEVFKYWATGQGLKSFFIEEIEIRSANEIINEVDEVKSGDEYSWTWRHGYSISGQFTEVVTGKLLSFTFGDMLVTLTFKEENSRCLVSLKQTQISNDSSGMVMGHLNCRSCWVFFMTNLKSIILNGSDLRDDDPDITSSYEVGFEPV